MYGFFGSARDSAAISGAQVVATVTFNATGSEKLNPQVSRFGGQMSNEEAVQQIQENPYLQYFVGLPGSCLSG
jgi:hypothetical protein